MPLTDRLCRQRRAIGHPGAHAARGASLAAARRRRPIEL